MNDFWSAWPWPLATAVLGFAFAWLVFKQWLDRRKPHQLAWTIGLLFYSIAAVMESWSEYAQNWDPTIYRFYIVLAASLVGFLGLGSLYLIVRRRIWGHLYLAYTLVALAVFLYGTLTAKLVSTPAEAAAATGPVLLAYMLKPGITVGGAALGAGTSFPRVMSLFFNIPGTLFLLGGALLSVWRFAGKREYHYRMWANVLIALGTIVIAFVGGKARAGSTVGLYPAEMVASALLLWGFLMAGTLEKGARAASAARKQARTEATSSADGPPPPAEAG